MWRLFPLPLTLAALALALPIRNHTPSQFGRVVNDDGPVFAAIVRIKGTDVFTRSNHRGHFRLPRMRGRLTAWAEGHFIAGGRSPLRLEPLPTQDNEDYAWIDPTPDITDSGQRCGSCHGHMYREWAGSGHARAATSKHFRALYDDLLAEHPNGAGVCSSCHAPTVRDEPALFDLRQVRGVDALGVHCDYCHKVAGPSDGELGLTHGRFYLRLLRPTHGQLFFGPLDDVDRGEDAYSPFYRDSRYCAACHEGVVFGVPVYTTYSEWLASPARRAGKHCQHCHMKPTGKLRNIAPGRGGIERDPSTLANHHFWDGSQEEMLRRCLTLKVQWERQAGQLALTIRLEARDVGHSVPTGFIDRQLILLAEATDSSGQSVALVRGSRLPAVTGAELSGKPGRLYARILSDEKERFPVPFWRALPDVTDTRLRPEVPDVRQFVWERKVVSVRVRVLHRRFWAATARSKGWTDRDLVVLDRRYDVGVR